MKEIPAAVETPSASPRGLPRLRDHRLPRRRRPDRARPALAAVAAPRRPAVARGVHGADRRPADVPRRRGALRGVRARRRRCPARSAGPGSSCSASRSSYLATDASSRAADLAPSGGGGVSGIALATLVAVGIGLHNLGEGLAIGIVVRARRAHARDVPDRRLHDPQRHRGARDRGAARRGGRSRARTAAALGADADRRRARDPRRLDRRLPRATTSSACRLLRRRRRRRAPGRRRGRPLRRPPRPGGLTSGYAIGGFLAGLAVMYVTGLLAA